MATVYSAAHFAVSGVAAPLERPNLGQIEEEAAPLRVFLASGGSLTSNNPRQYGPVFMFVMHPLLRVWGGDPERLSHALYALQLVCVAAAFGFTWMTLAPLMPVGLTWVALAALAFLWLNFAPLYTILAVKNVETWELALISVALWAYTSGRRALAGFAVAAAGLIKLLPFAFLFYFLLRDRRAFAWGCASVLVLLLVGQALYGQQMGLGYLPNVARSAAGNSFAMGWHENISLKGMIAKQIGFLQTTDTSPIDERQLDPAYQVSLGLGETKYMVTLTRAQLREVRNIAWAAQACGLLLLTWACMRGAHGTRNRTVWDWSLVAAMTLILSPQTAFEYCTLALGAFSYLIVRWLAAPARSAPRHWLPLAGAIVLIANLLPRQVMNRVVFVDAITRWTGYTHLKPSEAYQYFGFPFVGLVLLVVALSQVSDEPVAVAV